MAKNKNRKNRTISQQEANAYKAIAEGKAVLVTAWMPVIKPVILSGIAVIAFLIAMHMGIDLPTLFKVISVLPIQ